MVSYNVDISMSTVMAIGIRSNDLLAHEPAEGYIEDVWTWSGSVMVNEIRQIGLPGIQLVLAQSAPDTVKDRCQGGWPLDLRVFG